MKFRAKIFLAVLLTSGLLVAAAVGIALRDLDRRSVDAAEREFELAEGALRRAIQERAEQLLEGSALLGGSARLRGMAGEAEESGDEAALRKDFTDYLGSVGLANPEFALLRIAKGKVLTRIVKWGGPEVPPESEPWMYGQIPGFGLVGGRPCITVAFPVTGSHFLVVRGKDVGDILEKLSESLHLGIVLRKKGQLVFPELEVASGKESFRIRRSPMVDSKLASDLDLELYRWTNDENRERLRTLLVGGGALLAALGLAALVSSVVSRGISKPVDTLVNATQRVAGGDYAVQVDIPGRDEMAELGGAFNEMTEGLRKRREIMDKTLSRDVADQLMKNVDLGGARREVTILFMDVRGFTSTTEGMDPAEVVDMLNGVLDRLAQAISRHHGNVNKYLGDGIMAMFGAPKPDPDHALNAVRAAIDMQKAIAEWTAERVKAGKGGLRIGIGVNTGIVLAGNVGSRDRLEYTLIGEEVNLTSRICGKAGPGQIYITKQTLDQLKGAIPTKALEPINVKGLSYPVAVHLVEA